MQLTWESFKNISSSMFPGTISENQIAKFQQLHVLLTEWNKMHNLTRLTELSDFLTGHLLDSLTLGPTIKSLDPNTLLDIGAGAGFPSIPLAIIFPDISVTAMDATQKKTAFIEHVKKELALPNLNILTGRAEELAHREVYREQFDVVTARAVASLPVLVELALPFVSPDGYFIAMKTPQALEAECSGLKQAGLALGGNIETEIKDVSIPEHLPSRNLLIVKKLHETPSLYPRKMAQIKKAPLY